jgi:hypothetical protein
MAGIILIVSLFTDALDSTVVAIIFAMILAVLGLLSRGFRKK